MTFTTSPPPSAAHRATQPKLAATSPRVHANGRPEARTISQTEARAISQGRLSGALSKTTLSVRAKRGSGSSGPGLLGRYLDPDARLRQVVALPGAAGSVLVVDRDAVTLGDRRLVAHLLADEPHENAALVCEHYLRDPAGRWCRRVTPEDLEVVPFAEAEELEPDAGEASSATVITDRQGRIYRLELNTAGMSIPELRWCRYSSTVEGEPPEPVSMREAIASLESYEPVRMLTLRALTLHGEDPAISTAVLRIERARLETSQIVLNRGLRRATLAAAATQGLSMSEIAVRCGRVKHDSRGKESGETSWLARRLGIAPESGGNSPTPWIHSDVLALIARCGLGVSPREVELG